ncbi:MAG: hypothetical protein PSN37_00655 [Alphaproteobacteria bacterium]|nr:hypothetical protein [Alphaproteobacteria bacterium]
MERVSSTINDWPLTSFGSVPGGRVISNPNFVPGEPVSVILNEVVTSNRSVLVADLSIHPVVF